MFCLKQLYTHLFSFNVKFEDIVWLNIPQCVCVWYKEVDVIGIKWDVVCMDLRPVLGEDNGERACSSLKGLFID